MTDTLLEQIKADREIGTQGPWEYVESMSSDGQEWFGCGVTQLGSNCEFVWLENDPETDTPDARRIARVPDLEAAYIALTEARARDAETIKALTEALAAKGAADALLSMRADQAVLTVDPHIGWPDGLKVPMNMPPQSDDDWDTVAHLDHEDSGYGPMLWDYAITVLKAFRAAQEKNDG